MGSNPKTGLEVLIAPRRAHAFHPSHVPKEARNGDTLASTREARLTQLLTELLELKSRLQSARRKLA